MRLFVYLARHCLGCVALVQCLLVLLVVILRLVENIGDLARQADAGEAALLLASLSAGEQAYQVLPIACCIGVLVSGTLLARGGELLAVQAAGGGPWLSWGPPLAVALGLGLLGAGLGEGLLPQLVRLQGRLQGIARQDPLSRFYGRQLHWFRDGTTFLHLPEPSTEAPVSFVSPSLYRTEAGQVTEVLRGSRLAYEAGQWWLEDAESWRLDRPELQRQARLPLQLAVTPRDLLDVTGNPREMRYGAVRALLRRRHRAGFETAAYALELHQRPLYPLNVAALVLIALPWAAQPSRQRSLAAALGGGAALMAMVLAAGQLLRLLALAHRLGPASCAWGTLALWLALAPLSWLLQRRLGS